MKAIITTTSQTSTSAIVSIFQDNEVYFTCSAAGYELDQDTHPDQVEQILSDLDRAKIEYDLELDLFCIIEQADGYREVTAGEYTWTSKMRPAAIVEHYELI